MTMKRFFLTQLYFLPASPVEWLKRLVCCHRDTLVFSTFVRCSVLPQVTHNYPFFQTAVLWLNLFYAKQLMSLASHWWSHAAFGWVCRPIQELDWLISRTCVRKWNKNRSVYIIFRKFVYFQYCTSKIYFQSNVWLYFCQMGHFDPEKK